MARKITRSFNTTKCNITYYDKVEKSVSEMELVVMGAYDNDIKLEKAIIKELNNNYSDRKLIDIDSRLSEIASYEMSEDDFIAHATYVGSVEGKKTKVKGGDK